MDVSPHKDEHLELCAGYVLGNLAEDERRMLEAHLEEGCAVCEVEINRLGRGAWAFAAATPRLLEPPSIRARVLDTVRRESGQKDRGRAGSRAPIPFPRRQVGRALGWLAAAAAVVFAVFGYTEWRLAGHLSQELAASRENASRLSQEIQSAREWAAVATAPQTRVIDLKATPNGSAQLHARVTYDPATRRAILSVAGFATPAGKDYELWAITKSGPASLGLVRADSSGHALIQLTNAGDPFTLAAFAVSLENEGGAPTPTAPAGPVVMAGKI
jgi:anti-sigma-K factor RskA